MKAYQNLYTTIINGETYNKYGSMYLSEECENDRSMLVKWADLDEFYYYYGLLLPFNVWHTKKGKRISFLEGSIFKRDIKEWKDPDFSFTMNVTVKEYDNFSINDILNYHDSEKAIKFLVERGLSVAK